MVSFATHMHAGDGWLRTAPGERADEYQGQMTVVGFTYDVTGHVEVHGSGRVIKLRVHYERPAPVPEQDNRA